MISKYPKLKLRVFNFGAGGSYSFRQSQILNSEILNYSPNIVISFDGFNDAFYWHLEPKRGNKNLLENKPIPNWADYSYKNYLRFIGFETKKNWTVFSRI